MGPHAGGAKALNKSSSVAVVAATLTNIQVGHQGVAQGPGGSDRFVSTQRQAVEQHAQPTKLS
jgi:hypothetical protein